MKFLSVPPKALNTGIEISTWFDRIFRGAFKNINTETVKFYMISEPEDPEINSSVMWMSDGNGFGDIGDICIKINVNGTIENRIIADY